MRIVKDVIRSYRFLIFGRPRYSWPIVYTRFTEYYEDDSYSLCSEIKNVNFEYFLTFVSLAIIFLIILLYGD